ncbi:MAG: hypothetical protein HQM12_09285 [SAR324 cluster bacterium]|nr:hypothetical protein [SAR324 cluster bacterium]
MKFQKRLLLSILFLSWQVSTASAGTPAISGELYSGLHSLTPENSKQGYSQTLMDYRAYLTLEDSLVVNEQDKLSIGGKLTLLSDTTGTAPYEAYGELSKGMFRTRMGLIDVGGRNGIALGHEFMTELGKTHQGSYGNNDHAQPNLEVSIFPISEAEISLAYSTRSGDISVAADENQGNVGVANLLGKVDFDFFDFGLEYEAKSFTDNDFNVDATGAKNAVKKTESYLGLSLSFTFLSQSLTPFLNLGSSGVNDGAGEIKNVADVNLGIDIDLTRNLGTTFAIEQRKVDTINVQNIYLGLSYTLAKKLISRASYWMSDQKAADGLENLKSQLDLELAYLF